MAGGKKRKKPFQNNPFKTLKGFSVSAPPKERPPESGKKTPSVPAGGGEGDAFAEEMARLGVRKVPEEGQGEVADLPGTEDRAEPREDRGEEESPMGDEELFLAALGRMDVSFKDEIPPGKEPSPPPRRMKQLRQGKRAPEATLDLHGCTREEARQKAGFFLEDAGYQGKRTVLIITGKGRRSAAEPVLRAEMERYLSGDAAAWVSEWGRAPARYGGEGALVVFLKKRT